MILLFPGQWHRYSPDRATGWDEYWIAFGGRRAAEWMAEHGFDARNPVVEPGGGEALLHPYLRAIEETRAGRPGFPLVVASCCVELVAQAAAALRRQAFGDAELGGRIESAKLTSPDWGSTRSMEICAAAGLASRIAVVRRSVVHLFIRDLFFAKIGNYSGNPVYLSVKELL